MTPPEAGALSRIARFSASLASSPWFVACGEPLTAAEIDEARSWLGGMGLEVLRVEGVADWEDASRIAQSPDWSREWWDAEEAERKRLYDIAAQASGEAGLLKVLSGVAEVATRVLHGAAAVAAARGGVADPMLTRVAAGAATQACHQAALALAAGVGENHGFVAKHRLFIGGRWPLGVVGDRAFMF